MMTWLFIMSGITLFFYFGGIITNTASSTLLDMVLNPERAQNLSLFLKISSITTLTIIVISTFVARSQNSDFYLMVPVVGILFTFGWDFLTIYNTIAATSAIGGYIAVMIFGPLMIAYIMSVIEWWRGINP